MKTVGQMQAFLGNGNQHVSADCNPDLRLDGALVGAIKRLDAQVLLDPFEKQFDLPALAVQVCNQLGLESEVVGQKSYSLSVHRPLPPRVAVWWDSLCWNRKLSVHPFTASKYRYKSFMKLCAPSS